MRGKTVVITGGTSGIGEVAAVALAKMGARIVLVARDKSRGDATLARLRDNAPSIAHSVYFADLLRLAEMKRVAAEIAHREPHIDVLINNAGALFAKRRLTEDGLERTFALNHMAYFVMTAGLRKRLLASVPARIINTASAAHQDASLDFDDSNQQRTSEEGKLMVSRSYAISYSRVNSLAACKVRVLLRIACIPASSLHVLATKAVA
jgi:NAD(P)-dependent dehydrogenase (short-subunit alcohol dehydrogenase family)